jgi:hypothetical protein
MPQSSLDPWKNDMLAGKRLPAWIRATSGPERAALITALKTEDGFRSQFRAESAAPKSEVAIIEWGNHIEGLRKARSEAREATAKSWQMWLVFGVLVCGIAATIVAAILKK